MRIGAAIAIAARMLADTWDKLAARLRGGIVGILNWARIREERRHSSRDELRTLKWGRCPPPPMQVTLVVAVSPGDGDAQLIIPWTRAVHNERADRQGSK